MQAFLLALGKAFQIWLYSTLLLWVFGSLPLSTAATTTAYVSTDLQFQQALTDPHISLIILQQDIQLKQSNWAGFYSTDQPYQLRRNLTISSDPGFRVLDFAFVVDGRVHLGPDVWFNVSNTIVQNTRYGSGIQVDFVAPSPGGLVIFWNAIILRATCMTISGEPQAVALQPRLPGFPGQQRANYLDNYCFRDQCISKVLVYEDFTKISVTTADTAAGGYAMVLQNTTKVCLSYTDDCVHASNVDVCVQRALDAARTTAPTPGQLTATAAAAAAAAQQQNVIVRAVAGAAAGAAGLLAVLILLMVWRRRRGRLHSQAQAALGGEGLLHGNKGPGGAEAAQLSMNKDPEAGCAGQEGFSKGHQQRGNITAVISANDSPSQVQGTWEIAAWKTSVHFLRYVEQQQQNASSGLDSTAMQLGRAWCSKAPQSSYDLIMQTTAANASPLAVAANRVSLGVLLGAGSFGRVYKGRWQGIDVAVKVVHHSQAATSTVANEVDLMMNFRHPNVVRAHHFVTWRRRGHRFAENVEPLHDGPSIPAVHQADGAGEGSEGAADDSCVDTQTWIVQEFCDAGSLSDYCLIHGPKREGQLPEGHAMLRLLFRLREVADGMSYLHDTASVVHGDLKGSNILLTVAPTAPYGRTAKVTDFGLSRVHAVGQTHRSTWSLGTISHMAPELLRYGKASVAADVYSFGIMMWELLTGQIAFSGMQWGAIIEQVALLGHRPPIPEGAPEDYCLLMMSCWHPQPTERPDFKQILGCLQIMITTRQQELAEAASTSSPGANPSSSTLPSSGSFGPAAAAAVMQAASSLAGEFDLPRHGSFRHLSQGTNASSVSSTGAAGPASAEPGQQQQQQQGVQQQLQRSVRFAAVQPQQQQQQQQQAGAVHDLGGPRDCDGPRDL